MNLDHDFFQVSKLSEEQKKVFTKNGTHFSPNSGEDQKKCLHQKWNQARSQKFAMGGGLRFESGGAEPPAAEGQWDLGVKPPAAGGTGVWWRSPSARKFCIFLQK